MISRVFYIFIFLSCFAVKKANAQETIKDSSVITEIFCDTIYPGKHYKLVLKRFEFKNKFDTESYNSVFYFFKYINGSYKELYHDSLLSTSQYVSYEDFNGDRIKDILIQSYYDVRSNSAYNLYTVDTFQNRLKKIIGFSQIKNPKYLPQYNIVWCYVLSGMNWVGFYKIKKEQVFDYNIIINDNLSDTGKNTFDKQFKRAIKKILALEKKKK